jgi:hypothetical protein
LDSEEISTPTDEEGRSTEEREPMLPPQAEVAVESSLEEAILVEGMYSSQLVVTMYRSHYG